MSDNDIPCPICGEMFELYEDYDTESPCGNCGMVWCGDPGMALDGLVPVLTRKDCEVLRMLRIGID